VVKEKVVKNMNWKDLMKYFIHGLAFSILFFVLAVAWTFILVILVGVGAIIGLIIGVGLLFLIVGFLNSVVTAYLWFEVKFRLLDILLHGIFLFVVLFVVNGIVVAVPNLVLPRIATSVIAFVIAAFLDGFAAKRVARWWKAEYVPGVPGARVLRLERVSGERLAFGIGKNVLAIIVELAIIFPVIWIFSSSIRSYSSLLTTTLQIIPPNPTLDAYFWAFFESPFWTWLKNSLFVCLFTTGFCIAIASPAAYAMSRFSFLGKKPLLYALIFIQFVPGILLIIAFFQLLVWFGLYDNLAGLILIYTALVLPFNVWNMKAFLDTIPKDIDEAALIDGASYLGAMFNVVFPISAPGIAVTAFFSFLTGWNEYALASIVLGSEENYTLPMGLYGLTQVQYQVNWPHFAALSILSSIPLVIVFMILQRYLRAGLAIGAVKG